jgi:hypothetical protein
MTTNTHEPPLADDLLDGVEAISAFTGWPAGAIYRLAPSLPLFKMRRRWQGRKSTLWRYIEKLEAEAGAPRDAAE